MNLRKIISYLVCLILLVTTCQKENKSSANIEEFLSLGKTYGYLKYFYPGDECAALDWDKFGIYAAEQIDQGANLKETLEAIYAPLVMDLKFYETSTFSEDIRTQTSMLDTSQIIYWQHLGNGKGKIGAHYKSMRVNRPAYVLPDSPNDYGGVRRELEIEQLLGKKVLLSALLRPHSDYIGMGSLRLHLKPKGQPWIRYHSTEQIARQEEWNLHQLEIEIPENIERAVLYLQTIGLMGTIDFDQVELQIQNDEAPIDIRLNNAAFDEAASFETDWKPSGPNQDFAIKNENGNPYLSASRTKGSLEYTPPLFPKNTLKDKFLHKPVGNGLSIEFPMVISKDEQTKFSVSKAGAFEALQSKVDSIQNISLENKYVRLANLVKAWNNFQHFYPYFDLIDLDWEDQLRQAILQNETDQNMADHLKTLKIMLAPLKDSHLGVYTQADQFFPPIKVEIAEDHLVLTEVLDAKLSLKPGNSIIRINGQNVEAYWDEHSQKAQGATLTRKALTTIEEILAGTENSFLELELVGLDTAVQLRRTWSEHTYGTVSSKLDRSPFLEMETGIYYINLSEVSWEFLQEQMQLLAGAKGLVFDLRGYPSWKTINIVSHLTEDTLQQLQLYTPEVLFPDQENRSWQPSEVVKMYPNKPLLDAKKIFLTDANAISYSETFLNLIKHYQLATIVGQQTAGSTGNVNMLYLYGGISIPWTGMKVLDQNGAAFQGHGILPDYPVAKTIKGISNGQDEYLNAALKILYQQLN